MSDPIRLNLGAGDVEIPGFIPIDRKLDRWKQVEAYPLDDYADASIEEIRASHILEHFPWREAQNVLNEWVRVLKPGGTLSVAVPNAEWVIEHYDREKLSPEQLTYLIAVTMGGQTDENDYHRCMFTPGLLAGMMEAAGLTDIEPWESEVQDCAALECSLNLRGKKPMPEPARASDSPFSWLEAHSANKYSQWGEDGVIEAIFERLGTRNKWCIECGAGDGLRYSNTRKLVEEGWNAVWVEKDLDAARQVQEHLRVMGFEFQDDGPGRRALRWSRGDQVVWLAPLAATCQGVTSLDSILAASGCPPDPDLLVLDVDGQEYYLWNSLLQFTPRVVICEYDPAALEVSYVPQLDGPGQAGRDAIIGIAYSKQYRPVAQIAANLVFVQIGDLEAMADSDVQAIHRFPIRDRVKALLSCPRFGPLEYGACAFAAFFPLGIQLEMTGGVFWNQTLERLMEKHLDDGTAFLLTTDFDSIFTKEDVLALHRLIEEHPEVDALVPVQAKRGAKSPLFTMRDRDGNARATVTADEMQQDLVPISSGHFGLTMIRVSALKKLPRPWLWESPSPNPEHPWDDDREDSDVRFWRLMREASMGIYLAPRVAIGHVEVGVKWAGKDLAPVIQHIQEYNDHGKPEEAWR